MAVVGLESSFVDTARSGMPFVTFQYAQLLRVIRDRSTSGATFHLANFEFWQEWASHSLAGISESKDLVALQVGRMSSQILVSIVQAVYRSGRSDEIDQLAETAHNIHNDYLSKLQQVTRLKEYTMSWIDALDVFSIGICICYLSCAVNIVSPRPVVTSRPVRMAIELLTLSAERYSDVRLLGELLSMFLDYVNTRDRTFAFSVDTTIREAVDSEICLPNRDRELVQSALAIAINTPSFVSAGT